VFETGSTDVAAPAVLLVHGLGHWTQAAWDPIVPYLDPAWRIVALDLPGFGSSAKPDARYDAAFFAAALDRIATELPPRFALAGHSLGGALAARYAAAHPERVTRLALIAPAGFLRVASIVYAALGSPPAQWLLQRRPSRRFIDRILNDSVADPRAIDPAIRERAFALSQEPAMRRSFARVYAAAMREFADSKRIATQLRAWTGPTLIIWGRDDRYVPVRGLADTKAVYPDASSIVFDGAGHVVMADKPAECGAALREFFA
jgi:4,5:9,10-diseco-3-hydroxy-5,9,17-trioxoandrosta-1(10),2-diene-4-oate hydrolase